MYDKLIKQLRECTAEMNGENTLWHQAADAIEELQVVVDRLTAQTNMVFEKTEGRTVIKFEPKWIPVTERLPEDGEYLVAYTLNIIPPKKVIDVCYFAKNLYKVDKYDFADKKRKSGFYQYDGEYGFYERTGITHWMPLPQPPKEE